jgi:MoxR-like ATPase
MLKLKVGYPDIAQEKDILHRRQARGQDEVSLKRATNAKEILAMRQVVETVHVDPDLEGYIAEIVHETRKDRRVAVGASPRGSLAFLKMARAHAALEGRDFIIPDDIKRFALPILGHRLILQPELWMAQHVVEDVISNVFDRVPVPVIQ